MQILGLINSKVRSTINCEALNFLHSKALNGKRSRKTGAAQKRGRFFCVKIHFILRKIPERLRM